MNNYEYVPEDTITGKDLDYLKDMFQWNYNAYKETCHALEEIQDMDLREVFESSKTLFDENMALIQAIISNPGGDFNE